MGSDFDWTKEEPVVKEQLAVAVYRNEIGEVVIRQRSPIGEDDHLIFLNDESADRVAQAILSLLRG